MSRSTTALSRKARTGTSAGQRAEALCELAWMLRNTDPRRAREHAEEARTLAAGVDEVLSARADVVLAALDVLRSQTESVRPKLEAALAVLEEHEEHAAAVRGTITLANAAIFDNDIDGGERLARRALKRARSAHEKGLEHDAMLLVAQVMARRGQYERALSWASRAGGLLDETEEERRGYLLSFEASVRFLYDAPPEALRLYREALEIATRVGNTRLRCTILGLLSRTEAELGDYAAALDHAIENARLAEELEMTATLARAYTAIGIIHKRFGDYAKAAELATRTLELARGIGNRMLEASALNAIANCRYAGLAYDEAMRLYREAERIAAEINDNELRSDLLQNIANVLRDQRAFDEAFEHYSESLTIGRQLGDAQRMTELHLNIGRLEIDQERFAQAIATLEKGRAMAEEIGNSALLAELDGELAGCYEKTGDAARALAALREHMRLKGDLTSAARQREIAALESRAANERIERERQAERFERERLALEVQHRTEELTALGVHLAERTDLIGTISEELASALETSGEERERRLRSLLSSIRERQHAEGDWKEFSERMESVHHGFLVELARRYPSLTPAELRICALLRTQLSSKEIATLFGRTERAIEKHRFSIRRKLALEPETNLVAFLTSL